MIIMDNKKPSLQSRRNIQNTLSIQEMRGCKVQFGIKDFVCKVQLNVGCFINDYTQTRSCIRIIEFDTNTSKVLQDFNIGHIGASLYYPALSVDKSGNNIGIIFGYSSSDTYPSLLVGS